ncbi:ubiquinone/menaquinone biosynthesis methyltransferase [Candidatus Saganbacteria bacterium]|nr:ubiquinone/menaquinone biosynthesis methyltransferase [Candidatus Saganbacteria bacterium]
MNNHNKALMRPASNISMFDKISKRYDLLNKLLSFGRDKYWREQAVDLLRIKDGGSYVDAGCGTADLSIEIAGRFKNKSGKVLGVDHSMNMLVIGKSKIADAKLSSLVTLVHGDALTLPNGSGSVDGVISGFVIRNIDDRIGALKEWFRVLKPGGRVVILELSKPDNVFFLLGYLLLTKLLVPFLGLFLSKHQPYKYLIDSIDAFPSPQIFMGMMRDSGFNDVEMGPMTFGVAKTYCGIKPCSACSGHKHNRHRHCFLSTMSKAKGFACIANIYSSAGTCGLKSSDQCASAVE